jgi:hypothetical protein
MSDPFICDGFKWQTVFLVFLMALLMGIALGLYLRRFISFSVPEPAAKPIHELQANASKQKG